MSPEQIVFYFFAGLTLVSALLVVSIKNLVRSIFLFFVTIFSLAGLFVFALADFIAVTQVIIYVGGVLVLMLFAFMLSGAIVIEYIFNWPGIGRYAVQSILALDLPAVMGTTLVFTLAVVTVNLLADIAYAVLDPRIRLD